MALMSNGKGKKLEKREGEFDEKLNIYYTKLPEGWCATDAFSGMAIVIKKPTKKECQETVKNSTEKIAQARNSEKYLQGVINYNELLEE